MFWNQSDPQRKTDERRAFMTDLSLLGGLIIAAVDTEGKPSLGWRGRRAARKVSEAVSSALPVGASSGGALADSAFAFACNSYNASTVAAGCTIEFLAPSREGDVLTATAREHSLVGRTGIYDVDVTNQHGDIIALFRGKSGRIKGTVI